MLLPALIAAGFALTSNAFLLPPDLAFNDKAAENHGTPKLISSQSHDVTLDCSDCPFALASERNGLHEWTNSVQSDLSLRFTAEDGKLKLNGVPFYPISPPFAPAPLSVKQTKKSEDGKGGSHQGYDGDLRLSYSIEVHNVKGSSGPGKAATATEITFSLLGLDNEVLHVDDLKIKTLSLPNPAKGHDELFIVAVDKEAMDSDSADPQCLTIICRAMYKLKSATHKVKAHAKTAAYKVKCICIKCFNAMRHGHHHHHSQHSATPNQAGQPMPLPTHNRVRPGHFNPHQHANIRHHSWTQAFARASRQVFSFVLLPILIGIVFGIATSAIGMLVGQLLVTVWLRLRGHPSSSVAYRRVETEEKDGPPRYEDLEDGQTVADEKA